VRLSAKGLESDSCLGGDFPLSPHSSILSRRLFCIIDLNDDLPRVAVASGPLRLCKASDKVER
jgi:hypothetical protein